MWSMILLMSRLPGGHSRSAGRRKSSATNSRQSADRHYQAIGVDSQETDWEDHLRSNSLHVKPFSTQLNLQYDAIFIRAATATKYGDLWPVRRFVSETVRDTAQLESYCKMAKKSIKKTPRPNLS